MIEAAKDLYYIEPRRDYQDTFCRFLDRNGFDMYGYNKKEDACTDNDVFTIRPYYWGEDEEEAELPNFVFKPTGLEIRWYKYPMRSAYSNQNVDLKAFKSILKQCEQALKEMEKSNG